MLCFVRKYLETGNIVRKADLIREYHRAGGFTNRHIATLTESTLRHVQMVVRRAKNYSEQRDMRQYLAAILAKVEVLEKRIAALEADRGMAK